MSSGECIICKSRFVCFECGSKEKSFLQTKWSAAAGTRSSNLEYYYTLQLAC